MSSEIDGTRLADPGVELHRRERGAAPDETRAVVEDGTRMLNPSELPNWVAQEKRTKVGSTKHMWAATLLVGLLLGTSATYWFRQTQRSAAAGSTLEHQGLPLRIQH